MYVIYVIKIHINSITKLLIGGGISSMFCKNNGVYQWNPLKHQWESDSVDKSDEKLWYSIKEVKILH